MDTTVNTNDKIRQEKPAENKMVSEKMRNTPVGKLLISMSLPAMLSMLVQALYNVMDTVYVGMYYSSFGEEYYIASTQALSIAFPMQMIICAFGIGIGVGANATISRKLGEKDPEGASQTARLGILMAMISAVIMIFVGLFLSEPMVRALSDVSGDGGLVIQYGIEYLTIVASVSFAQVLELTGTRILQSTGNMKIPMIAQIAGAVINIIFDPILIFGFSMGVKGAAIATVFSQFCSMAITYYALIFRKQDVNIDLRKIKITGKGIREIVNVGVPALILNAIGAVTYVSLLIIIKENAFGGVVQQVLGLYFRLNSIVFMPVFGMMQGLLPILGYSYGAGSKERYVKCFKLSNLLCLGFLIVGLVLFEVFPSFLLGLFSAGEQTIREGVPALRIIAICFPFAALGINAINAFQSLQCGIKSLLMSIFRQIGIIIPFAIICSRFGTWGIWAAYPVAECLAVLVFEPMLIHEINKKFA